MRLLKTVVAGVVLWVSVALGQSDRGTITGTITDPAGAVVVDAAVEAVNIQTKALYQAASTGTGNFTLAQVPTGNYELSVKAPGFKTFIRQNLIVPVAQTIRVDAVLEVGATAESITVSDAAPLLKTESGELSHNVKTSTLNNLPVLGIGSGASAAGVRNPYAVIQLLPGTDYRPDRSVRINGMPSNSQSLRIEGQDATNNLIYNQSQTQPSVDAIEEFAIQTSNFAAEYGQVGGGFFNATMKSGTNEFHGTAYEYFVNEALNAGTPFTTDGQGHLLRPRNRRHDFGFTTGGPVWIPRVYDGHDKTFFFFNYEQFRETTITNNVPTTVPIDAYRVGDFSRALTQRNGCPTTNPNCDPLGRPILENAVYNPASEQIVNGLRVRDPFVNNTIPLAQQDPVALKIQDLIPRANRPGLINNYLISYTNPTLTYIPSIKLDHQLGARSKISGYWSRTYTESPNNVALPFPLNGVPRAITAHTTRINFDQTLTPTMLLHLGVGLLHNFVNQTVNRFDPVANLGLRGTYTDLFPSLQGLNSAQGGVVNMGPGTNAQILNTKPTANASLTWVRNNHTIKAGGELIVEGYPTYNETYANGWIVFSKLESGLPSTNTLQLPGGTPGFPYGSFLLGGVNNGFIGIPSKTRLGNRALAGFIQDTWKATRKLTIDYGLRYDFQTYLQEQHGRVPYFAPKVPNPSVSNRLGAVAFEGTGPGRCNCNIAQNYPHAWGPRVGVAYQMLEKTVLRAGIGISYYRTAMNGLNSYSTGSQNIYTAPSFGDPAYLLRDGLPYNVVWPNFDPGQTPLPGTIASPAQQVDQNAGRPARIFQWSIGVQRELASNLVVEATYVGNRGAWWNSTYLICLNCNTPEALLSQGLDIRKAADRLVLTSPISSSVAAQRGYNGLPYAGFPTGSTVAQAMRPFPHFSGITNVKWVPTGKTWYDALQVQLTKRYSHGLDLSSSFTWSRSFAMGTEADISTLSVTTPPTNDVFNRPQNKYLSGLDQPFLFVLAANYTTPGIGPKALSWATRDWTFGAVMRYGAGMPIMSPIASNVLNQMLFRSTGAVGTTGGTFMNRVEGQPVFTQDLNCRCFNPQSNFVLNRNAWQNPADGEWGVSAAYYTDYRFRRRPSESMSLGRNFRMGPEGRYNLQIRAEFSNIFNRTFLNDPVSNNALATQQTNPTTGLTTAGFGWINTATVAQPPRQGTLVGRFTF
jgi:hypothetical protein